METTKRIRLGDLWEDYASSSQHAPIKEGLFGVAFSVLYQHTFSTSQIHMRNVYTMLTMTAHLCALPIPCLGVHGPSESSE